MREIFSQIAWVRKVAVFFGALTLLVMVGPFGTYSDLGTAQRITYWTVTLSGVGFFMHVGMRAALTATMLSAVSQFLKIAVGAVIAAAPGAAVVIFVDTVFRGPGAEEAFPLITLQVFVIGLAIGLVEYVDWRPHTEQAAAAPPPPLPRLMDRLSPQNRGDLISQSMQDHYVEVTTTNGVELVLLRFADALEEVSASNGVRLHRSHWAAREHIEGVERKRGRIRAALSDGRSLPVSATYAEAVEAAVV